MSLIRSTDAFMFFFIQFTNDCEESSFCLFMPKEYYNFLQKCTSAPSVISVHSFLCHHCFQVCAVYLINILKYVFFLYMTAWNTNQVAALVTQTETIDVNAISADEIM